LGVAISGLTSDARALCQIIFNEALASRNDLDRPIPIRRLLSYLADKAQRNTQFYGSRPLGVGLLVAGIDDTGPHLFELQPSGLFYEYWGFSIGSRSQGARTYFEKHIDELPEAALEDLIKHAVDALTACLPPSQSLETGSFSIGVVGMNEPFRLLGQDELAKYIPPPQPAGVATTPESMEVEPTAAP
jgi:20S proteasome subunit alpha 6